MFILTTIVAWFYDARRSYGSWRVNLQERYAAVILLPILKKSKRHTIFTGLYASFYGYTNPVLQRMFQKQCTWKKTHH